MHRTVPPDPKILRIGLQFHPEFTPENIQRFVENCGDELTPGPHIQNSNACMQLLLGWMAKQSQSLSSS